MTFDPKSKADRDRMRRRINNDVQHRSAFSVTPGFNQFELDTLALLDALDEMERVIPSLKAVLPHLGRGSRYDRQAIRDFVNMWEAKAQP